MQKIYQKDAPKTPKLVVWSLIRRSLSISCCNFFTLLILISWEIPVKYRLITYLPKVFLVFPPFLFSSRCFYSAYTVLIVLSLVLLSLLCAHYLCRLINMFSLQLLFPLSISVYYADAHASRQVHQHTLSVYQKTPHRSVYFSTSDIMFITCHNYYI